MSQNQFYYNCIRYTNQIRLYWYDLTRRIELKKKGNKELFIFLTIIYSNYQRVTKQFAESNKNVIAQEKIARNV